MAAQFETQASFAEEIEFGDIKFEKIVGKGSFGVVSKASWRGRTVAVKMIETEEEIKAFKVEVTQLSRVNHPNIVSLYGACPARPNVCLVMEYAEGGSVYNVLHGNPQPIYTAAHAMSWALQTARGVAYLHAMRPKALIHRDLKPANLLLMAGGTELKICDFGTACDYQTYMTNNKGSAAWMAPEVFEGRQYSEKCDVFSWGIILWEVISRRKPFDEIGGPAFRIMWAVHQGTRPPKIRGLPKPLDILMNRCWSKEAPQRPSMEEVVKVMHPMLQYFKGQEQEPLTYPEEKEQIEEAHISMNLLDLEEASHDTNMNTGNSDYQGSRASTLSDTIIRPGESLHILKRDPSGSLKQRDPEYEKRRRSADILSYNKDDEAFNEEPKVAFKKGHRRYNSHGHIGQASITVDTTAVSNVVPPASPSITVSMADHTPKHPTHIRHSYTDPCLSEFDPLMTPKQRSNSDDTSQHLLNMTDASSGAERPRSGSLGGDGAPSVLSQSFSGLPEGQTQLIRPPDKPMRSVSLDQKVSQSKVDEDIEIPMAYMTLDHHLQPLPPNPKSRASVEIFDKHCEAAQEYMRVQTELVLLHQRKKELAGELDQDWKDQQASFKVIEEFNNLKTEKDNLVQCHRNLRAQLDLIRAQVQRKNTMTRRY